MEFGSVQAQQFLIEEKTTLRVQKIKSDFEKAVSAISDEIDQDDVMESWIDIIFEAFELDVNFTFDFWTAFIKKLSNDEGVYDIMKSRLAEIENES